MNSVNNENIILKAKRFWGFGIIFVNDLKNLKLLNYAYLGIISGIASWNPCGIYSLRYFDLGLKIYQGVNIYLTDKRIYSKYILIGKTIFDIPISNISNIQELFLKNGGGICITYKEVGEEKNVVLIFSREDASKWIKELIRLKTVNR